MSVNYVGNDYDYPINKNYTSSLMFPWLRWTYGTFEMRAALPMGQSIKIGTYLGPVSAREWALSGQITFMDYNQKDQMIVSQVTYGKPVINSIIHVNMSESKVDRFNVYKLVWTETELNFFVNDNQTLMFPLNQTLQQNNNYKKLGEPFDKPFYFGLSVQINEGAGAYHKDIYKQWNCSALIVDYMRCYS
ncbi:glucan endo-1,3-beta-glucosidase-like [Oppia nitens]|uniref:glucan endo-1,3-beta-glucosidase-like n=1 Tax=Oppia nitens TaxID=1686743 RepID=UPI0023DBD8B2|nr:glucan endo-1,3-beta-glucosidase-like [Oppia nitens]